MDFLLDPNIPWWQMEKCGTEIEKHQPRWWFQIYFLCSSLPGEMIQFDSYFSNGLKLPASNNLWNEQFEEDDVIVENGDWEKTASLLRYVFWPKRCIISIIMYIYIYDQQMYFYIYHSYIYISFMKIRPKTQLDEHWRGLHDIFFLSVLVLCCFQNLCNLAKIIVKNK